VAVVAVVAVDPWGVEGDERLENLLENVDSMLNSGCSRYSRVLPVKRVPLCDVVL
jgi:hypothetical protein